MISRRLLRIKTLKLLFSNAGSEELHMERIEKELLLSIQKTYDLYYYLFSAIIYVADYAEERITIGLQKHRPTHEEAYPNKKFINNSVLSLIRNNRALLQYCDKHHLSWGGDNANIIHDIYHRLIKRDYYKEYMASDNHAFDEDLEFLKKFFIFELEDNRALENMLEEQSIWWIDDVGYALGSILRALDNFTPDQSADTPLLQGSRSREDDDFATRLLRRSLTQYFKYWNRAMLFVQNWEADRVATMDMNLIIQGYSEAVEFPTIPIKVTINEHVEIAKYYSTHNSHVFVNAVLDRMIQQGIADGEVKKEGLGLVQTPAVRKRSK